jgi:hypothetical protein
MHFERSPFDPVQVDGITCEHHVVIDSWGDPQAQEKPSTQFREQFGHTPLSNEEDIPACGDFGDTFGAMALHSATIVLRPAHEICYLRQSQSW